MGGEHAPVLKMKNIKGMKCKIATSATDMARICGKIKCAIISSNVGVSNVHVKYVEHANQMLLDWTIVPFVAKVR